MIGEQLGHYRLLSQIGEGGMGVVYRARDEVLHRDVAVKVLATDMVEQMGHDHLLREAQTASALSHPNICTIHEVGKLGDGFYFVMELVEGKPLNELAATKLTTEAVMRCGIQIADALAHAHERGIVHRDLKGANVIVSPDSRVKVLDFGLARRLDKATIDEVTRSYASVVRDSAIVGTMPYMAPEVLAGQIGGVAGDLWSMGVLLYEAATGELPFRGGTAYELSAAILHAPPAALPENVPPGLAAVILRCLAKDPGQRFQRASEARSALEALQAAAIIRPPARPNPLGQMTIVQRGVAHPRIKNGDVILLVGTNKGAFLLRSGPTRSQWDVGGPYFHGQTVYAMAYDGRQRRHRLWASTGGPLWGTYLRSSDDFGKTWTSPVHASVRFPSDSGMTLKNIWKICLGRPGEDNTLYCGVEPAALFESHDAGESWSMVRSLFDHPHRTHWMPGQGGLCLHTILPNPTDKNRMHVAISAGGVYRTDDGGRSWQARNRGIRVTFKPDRYPEFGQCVHKVIANPAQPDRLYLQNHWGLYRSDDGGDNWTDIGHGLPSDFGFAMAIDPRDPDSVYVLPMESDEFRCTPEGRLRVYRSRDAGGSWQALTRGLPQEGAFETVLRDGMVADALDPFGIYFGTRSGKLFGSRDEGKTWKKLIDGLPQITCVAVAVVAGLAGPSADGASKARRAVSRSKRPAAAKAKKRPAQRGRAVRKRR
jgi:serine/threonine protein kinase/photosystem II stability/assembly factor-like uncharacterized protein